MLEQTDFSREVYCVLGLPFDAVDLAGAVLSIRHAIESRTPLFVSTPNTNFVVTSCTDPTFRDSTLRSDLSLVDGMPLVWIARWLGIPLKERVAGSTLFDALRAGDAGSVKVFFFGGREGVAREAHDRVNAYAGHLRSVGYLFPGFGSVEDMSTEASIEAINRAGADFVVVGLGSQKGQAWIERNRRAIDAPVISHLGAVIDFVAGKAVRAPGIVQKLGFEWLWRIKEEPALWRRYANDGLTLIGLIVSKVLPLILMRLTARFRSGPAAGIAVDRNGPQQQLRINLSGAWDPTTTGGLRHACASLVSQARDIVLDLSSLCSVDAGFIGTLMRLYGHQSNNGLGLRVIPPPRHVRHVFRLHGAGFLFEDELVSESARFPADVASAIPVDQVDS